MFLSSRHKADGSLDKAVKWWGRWVIKSTLYVSTGKTEIGQRNKEATRTDRRDKMAEVRKKGIRTKVTPLNT